MLAAVFAVMRQQAAAVIVVPVQCIAIRTAPEPQPKRAQRRARPAGAAPC
jgi:hypothetical protein